MQSHVLSPLPETVPSGIIPSRGATRVAIAKLTSGFRNGQMAEDNSVVRTTAFGIGPDPFAHGAPEPRKPNIKTHYDPPPIPTRDCDWSAIDDNTYDGPGCPIGWGSTEQEAIDDLLEKLLTTISRAVEPHLTELGAWGETGC